jgi:DNA-binding LacI/PurR family transcriptional regulator
MGAEAMKLLTAIINKEDIKEKNIILAYKLVQRESCRRL